MTKADERRTARAMNIFGDFTTIVTLAIAVFIFLRLRSVLGSRSGHQQRPMDRSREPLPPASDGNVVTLPRKPVRQNQPAEADSPAAVAVDAYAKPGSKLNTQLRALAIADPSFEPESFLNGARMAYEMIVTAFADGDRKALRNLLSREVFEGFSNAISQREAKGEQVRATFVGIDSSRIVSAEMVGSDMHVTARFVSQIISATYDKAGTLTEGDPEQVAEVIDIWTFARDSRSRDPNWKLVATESEA
jgi:predicted lipid-binding transport protein (Tim44 family)